MRLERAGLVLLLVATIVVAASILAGGTVGRVLNGVGGLCWFLAAGLLVTAGFRSTTRPAIWAIVTGATALLAFVIRPSDLILAMIGFGGAGLLLGICARNHERLWVAMVPALYLPFHIGAAVLRAVARSLSGAEAHIRSEPPPTAAIVPLVMVAAALAGGYAAVAIKSQRSHQEMRRVMPTREPR